MNETSLIHPENKLKDRNLNMRTGTQIFVSPKKNYKLSEQISMMREDYQSLKKQSTNEIRVRDILIQTYQQENKKEYSNFQREMNNLKEYYHGEINLLMKKDLENNQKINEKNLEIDKLKLIISKKCNLISLDEIEDFHCPISWELFKDPVILEDGFTYEREDISEWLTKNRSSPTTNRKLHNKRVIPNQILKNIINMHQELLLSLNNCKQQIITSENQIKVLTSEIESLSIQRDLIQDDLEKKKKSRKGCIFLF